MTSLRSRMLHLALQRVTEALVLVYSIPEQRIRMDELARRGIWIPRGVTIRKTSADGVPAEWIEPSGLKTHKVILYLHGGGYCICSIETHRGLAARLALASQRRLLNIDYRLAPENPFPAALEDALTAYRWLLAQGFPACQVAIGGDSAGGGLALAMAVSLRDAGEPLPGAIFLLSPWTDLTFSGESMRTRKGVDPIFGGESRLEFAPAYLGKNDPRNPLISPLFADLPGLPSAMIHVGSDEILLDDSVRLAKKLQDSGVTTQLTVWEGMWHVFPVFAPYIPEAELAIGQIGDFLRKT